MPKRRFRGCNAPGVRTVSRARHFRRPASEPPSPRHRAGPPLPSSARPSGRPRADLRSPAVARCYGPGAKALHATTPPCPRPPGLGAPPAIAWDSACDRSLAAPSSPAGVAVSPPPVDGDLAFRTGRVVFFSGKATVHRRRAAFSLSVFPIWSGAVVPEHLRSPGGIGHIGPIAFVKTRSLL